jgi:hypothetical protein
VMQLGSCPWRGGGILGRGSEATHFQALRICRMVRELKGGMRGAAGERKGGEDAPRVVFLWTPLPVWEPSVISGWMDGWLDG